MRKKVDDFAKLFLQKAGQDLREMREGAGMTQQEVADIFNWNRDAVSKIESGSINISLHHYLQIIQQFKELYPDHPALPLYDYLTKPRRARR
ncbi:helix-turn-helix domain-containing protein [Roseomonas sp. USHLN139]|uniref:helix-turn-helix domain-containing protein n=1 Tax=Roseomonas sp. USHLN139 TaxID=3081298 RepID=UPI003B018C2C